MKLTLVFPEYEYFDDSTQEFHLINKKEILMEHSLYTMSLWEEKFNKPYVSDDKKTKEEVNEYVKIMSNYELTDEDLLRLDSNSLNELKTYMENPASATTFGKKQEDKSYGEPQKQVVTTELIYWQMIHYGIPFECQHWHINRLQKLIKICQIKEYEANNPKKKGSMPNINSLSNRGSINAARRAAMNTSG